MAGGNWTAQNKVRPGVYINFTTKGGQPLTIGTRGTLAGARALSWGPVGELMRIDAGEDLTPYTGYSLTDPQNSFLREAMKGTDVTGGPTRILLYRLAAEGAAPASASIGVTVTAKYPGVRGNDIAVTVTEDADAAGTFTVTTLVSGRQADQQTVTEPFIQRIAAQSGRYAQLVTTGAAGANSRFVINNVSGVVLEDGATLTPQETAWWLAGAEAGAQYYQSLSYAAYPGAADVSPRQTGSQIEDAILAGNVVLSEEFGKVRIETDVNTLTAYTPDIGRVFHKNRTMRVCSSLANDIYREFSLHYLGKVNNNEEGRALLKAAIMSYLLAMYGSGALRQRPAKDDVTVSMGDSSDSIVIEIALYLADSVETIYITVSVT